MSRLPAHHRASAPRRLLTRPSRPRSSRPRQSALRLARADGQAMRVPYREHAEQVVPAFGSESEGSPCSLRVPNSAIQGTFDDNWEHQNPSKHGENHLLWRDYGTEGREFESLQARYKSPAKAGFLVSVQLVGGHNSAALNVGVWSGLRLRRSMTPGVRRSLRCCWRWIGGSRSLRRALSSLSAGSGATRVIRRCRRVRIRLARRRAGAGRIGPGARRWAVRP